MLTEERITILLNELEAALDEEQHAAEMVIAAIMDEKYTHAQLVLGNPPAGKNAEDRAKEVTILLAENADAINATVYRIKKEHSLEKTKTRVEVARAAIGLWKALT